MRKNLAIGLSAVVVAVGVGGAVWATPAGTGMPFGIGSSACIEQMAQVQGAAVPPMQGGVQEMLTFMQSPAHAQMHDAMHAQMHGRTMGPSQSPMRGWSHGPMMRGTTPASPDASGAPRAP